MLSSILNSPLAVEASIIIVRTFVKLRELILSYEKLEKKIEQLEMNYDEKFGMIFQIIKKLINNDNKNQERVMIGYINNK